MKKYKTSFSNEELHNALHSKESEAKDIIENVDKWNAFKTKITGFLKKAEKIPVLGGMIDDIECMICVVDSYVKKEYKEIPVSSIISIVASLVYILSPIDLIPDAIPVVGYLDDAAIIFLVLNFGIDKDLEKYRNWNEKNRQTALAKLKIAMSEEIKEYIGEGYLAAIIIGTVDNLKMIVSESADVDEWTEYRIKELSIPLNVFDSYSLEQESDILQFINEVIELDQITWTDGAEKVAYLEADFQDKWDNYIIGEE